MPYCEPLLQFQTYRKKLSTASSRPFNLILYTTPSIPNSTPPHYFPYMTIFLTLSPSNKSLASVFFLSICRLWYYWPLHRRSTWFGISYNGSLHMYHLTHLPMTFPHISPASPITCGVAQGSVLNPVLFNCYTTPLGWVAHAATRFPKHFDITTVLKLLHWLRVEQCIQYKIIFITNNLLHNWTKERSQAHYHHTHRQNSLLWSSVPFPLIWFHQAQVCW